MQKYLRSIGYYGESPFLLCNYGSSEYAQALSRIGSLNGNTYIVNNEVLINNANFRSEEEKKVFESVEINFSTFISSLIYYR